jgi:hypothetical protein
VAGLEEVSPFGLFTLHSLLFTLHSSLFTIHDSRFTIAFSPRCGYLSYSIGDVPKWIKGTLCKSVIHRFESDRRLENGCILCGRFFWQ